MRTVLKISTILTWFNTISWGFIVLLFLMAGLVTQQIFFIVIAFVMGAIVLHSYAALRLQRSIRDPAKPLSNQTPAGIRFIGIIAAFEGLYSFANGIATAYDSPNIVKAMLAQYPQMKGITVASLHIGAVFAIISGISIVVNVLLNFRLLRWYHFMKGMM